MTSSVDQKLAIALFVKTPGVTPAKTRLGKAIGQDNAELFYGLCLEVLDKRLLQFKKEHPDLIEVYWSVAEEDQLNNPHWKNHLRIYQGPGSLGSKLFNTQEQLLLKHKKVAFIGADLPQIPLPPLLEFAKNNQKKTIQFGPSFDGGFYLYLSDRPFSKELWEEVLYSKSDTLQHLRVKMLGSDSSLKELETLPEMRDVDEVSDLLFLKSSPDIEGPDYKTLRIFLSKVV